MKIFDLLFSGKSHRMAQEKVAMHVICVELNDATRAEVELLPGCWGSATAIKIAISSNCFSPTTPPSYSTHIISCHLLLSSFPKVLQLCYCCCHHQKTALCRRLSPTALPHHHQQHQPQQ